MTPVPDGARGNHFRNEKQDTICIELSVVSSPSPPCLYGALAKWTFNDPITLQWFFLQISNYDTSLFQMMHSWQAHIHNVQASVFVKKILQHCLSVHNAVKGFR